jgi:hypothetical protein
VFIWVKRKLRSRINDGQWRVEVGGIHSINEWFGYLVPITVATYVTILETMHQDRVRSCTSGTGICGWD